MSTSVSREAFEHPSMQGWLEAGRRLPDQGQQAALRERFMGTEHDTNVLLGALGTAVAMTDMYRQAHEAEALQALHVNDNLGQKHEYRQLAGKPERLLDFLVWFSRTAGFFFGHKDADRYDHFKEKIGLELGSARQAGSWDNTEGLDRAMETIPGLVRQRRDPGMALQVLSRRGQRVEAYRYATLPGEDNDRYGLVRRRRAVANLALTSNGLFTPDIHIFKESIGLVVLDQFSPTDQKKVRSELAASPDRNQWKDGANNTPAAHIAGHAFHDAVHARTSTQIVPVSAQYVAVAIRGSQA